MSTAKHDHKYSPYKRVKRLILSKCSCGITKTEIIGNFSETKAKEIDAKIAGGSK